MMIKAELITYDADRRQPDGSVPIIETVEVVRCRDCRWCMAYAKATYCDRFAHELPEVTLDGYCSWGERKE